MRERDNNAAERALAALLRWKMFWFVVLFMAACAFAVWRQYQQNAVSSGEADRLDGASGYSSEGPRPETRPRSSADSTNRYKKIDEDKLLKALADLDHAAGLNRCGRLLKEELERTGAYGSVGRFLATLPEKDTKALLSQWIIGSSTDLGPVGDYDEQKWMIDDLGLLDDLRLTDRLHYEAGGSAFPELALNRRVELSEDRVMEMALMGSIQHHGVDATIKVLPELLMDDHAAHIIKRGVKWSLANNPVEASSAIGELATGYPKDVMIEAMIVWLEGKGEISSIEAWIEQVSDVALRERLREKISQPSSESVEPGKGVGPR